MNFRIQTRYDEMCLCLKIVVKTPTTVRIKICDETKNKIIFTNRTKAVRNEEIFYIRMPLTSDSIILSVYDDRIGNLPKEQEKNITVISCQKQPLEKRMDVVDISNKSISEFVDFAQRFCFNASYLETGKSYQSDNGEFIIEYLDVITNKDGRALTTPARINQSTGRIQVAKKYIDEYTIPMRFAILCHEFSHYYVNDDIHDESEADINGLLIYLGLGYPRIEGYEAFYKVFMDAPSEANGKRFQRIDNFIRNFEKNKMVIR
jgi:hypothetical protein